MSDNRSWREIEANSLAFTRGCAAEGAALRLGKQYRVVKAPAGEYLTVGEVYVLDALSKLTVGLHRPNGGGGTYVRRFAITDQQIVLEEVQS